MLPCPSAAPVAPSANLPNCPTEQKAAGYTPQAYLDYVSWEREVKRPDTPLVKGIFERAVADHPTEIDLWDEYLGFLVRNPCAQFCTPQTLTTVSTRSTRSRRRNPTCVRCRRRRSATSRPRPRSGLPPCALPCVLLPLLHSLRPCSLYCRLQEKLGLGAEEVEALFQRAVATGYFAKDIEAHVALYHARASYYRREMDRNGAPALRLLAVRRRCSRACTPPATDDGPDAQLAGLAIGVLQEGIESNKKGACAATSAPSEVRADGAPAAQLTRRAATRNSASRSSSSAS